MKALILALGALLTSNAFAAGAASYDCVGKNRINGENVVFNVLFADSAPEAGYTNQSITVTKRGGKTLKNPIVFQMYGATKKNACKLNENGEINLPGRNFDMNDSSVSEGFKMSFESPCAGAKFSVVDAHCTAE